MTARNGATNPNSYGWYDVVSCDSVMGVGTERIDRFQAANRAEADRIAREKHGPNVLVTRSPRTPGATNHAGARSTSETSPGENADAHHTGPAAFDLPVRLRWRRPRLRHPGRARGRRTMTIAQQRPPLIIAIEAELVLTNRQALKRQALDALEQRTDLRTVFTIAETVGRAVQLLGGES